MIASCQAGRVRRRRRRRSRSAHSPGSPSRPTPYCASSRSKTVVTRWPSMRRTGTPRGQVGGGAVGGVEARHPHQRPVSLGAVEQRQLRVDVTEVEVPPADAGLAVAVAERAVRARPARRSRASIRTVLNAAFSSAAWLGEVGGGQELAGDVFAVGRLLQPHQVGQVGVGLHVLGEVRRLPVDEELLEHDVAHRHRQGGVGARLGGQPLVGELHVVGVVRGDRDRPSGRGSAPRSSSARPGVRVTGRLEPHMIR